jgi:hypothetical protein
MVNGVAWHGLRPYLVRALARSSVGSPVRTHLIAAAVKDLYPRFPVADSQYGECVWSFRDLSSGLVIWQTQPETEVLKASEQPRTARWIFADERLAYIGSVYSANWPLATLPGDWDRDASPEIAMHYSPDAQAFQTTRTPGASSTRLLRAWSFFRPASIGNEIAGIIVVDAQQWHKRRTALRTQWRDENGDGRAELAFVVRKIGALPGGGIGTLSEETVAVFEWTEPGGILRPRQIPDDGSFLVWTPEDGKPYEFSPDTVVEDLCRELLPIPDDFGWPSASQPASQPTTETATQPASP